MKKNQKIWENFKEKTDFSLSLIIEGNNEKKELYIPEWKSTNFRN
jgi:hypothetical protein